MPKNLQKSLQDYLSKIKKPTPHIQFPPNSLSSSTNWILSGCKHPKTLSFAVDRNQNHDAATLSDIDRFLFENFKSLYGKNDDNNEDNEKITSEEGKESPGGILFESPKLIDLPPDLCGSHRFFVTPGMSSSLIEEARTSATMSDDMASSSTTTTTLNENFTTVSDDHVKELTLPDECIAVLTYSPNPYDDFRRSMQEMIEARLHHHAKVDWDFMEELLFCYLNVNEKKSYKYILSAFVDQIVVLRQDSGKTPARSRKVRTAEERRRKG